MLNRAPNHGINIGHSSKLIYDKCAYDDYIQESTAPLLYKLNPILTTSCSPCMSVFGPRSSKDGYGVSTVGDINATSQRLRNTDIESILSNRNVMASKCRDAMVNPIDVTKFTLQHARTCNDFLDPIATRLTNPSANYRGMSINRFFDLPKNPQANIYWDGAVNTKLEAKDNFRERVPRLMRYDPTLPKELKGRTKPCQYTCSTGCNA